VAGEALVNVFRAGLLGLGTCFWLGGTLVLAQRESAFPAPSPELTIVGSTILGFYLALRFGYIERPKSYVALAGRVFGSVAVACLVGGATLLAVDGMSRHSRSLGFVLVARAGVVDVSIVVAWLYGRRLRAWVRSSTRAAVIAASAAMSLFFVTLWPASPSLRCALGSARACGDAALAALRDGDDAGAIRLAKRGCDMGDGYSCARAGDAFWGGYHDEHRYEGAQAEPLYRDACALGEARGCDLLHECQLHARCAAQSASACRDLGDLYGRDGKLANAARFLNDACLLGDPTACDRSR
jgi:hypothetical protein